MAWSVCCLTRQRQALAPAEKAATSYDTETWQELWKAILGWQWNGPPRERLKTLAKTYILPCAVATHAPRSERLVDLSGSEKPSAFSGLHD